MNESLAPSSDSAVVLTGVAVPVYTGLTGLTGFCATMDPDEQVRAAFASLKPHHLGLNEPHQQPNLTGIHSRFLLINFN